MTLRTTLFCSALLLTLAGCAGRSDPPETQQVDLQRYQGTWYELARLPMFFQRKCVQSEAHYSLRADGKIDVTNRCTQEDGQHDQVQGVAEPQVAGQTDKLWVSFDNGFSRLFPRLTRGQYWVLYHDQDYRVALVGHPNREYLWLLSRTEAVTDDTRNHLLEIARQQGYDISKLVWRKQD